MSQQPDIQQSPEELARVAQAASLQFQHVTVLTQRELRDLRVSAQQRLFGASPAGQRLNAVFSQAVATIDQIVHSASTASTGITEGSVQAANNTMAMDASGHEYYLNLARSSAAATDQLKDVFLGTQDGAQPGAVQPDAAPPATPAPGVVGDTTPPPAGGATP